ncbi:hypothetical protein [Cupriavidus pauculus]|uniref:hypothetical protein n=1 Tax=Cupriavidus pauculus TaxID=82633 RepID=UPI001248C80C|nr:hypothetical protein [Cupriavidus pauculus]KAB0599110.1 hypothetical protein F7R19_24710 [Cupriavidus pauculus]UAL01953.1 hypothetical protein K8O84_24370 [Cupriavidus pauculus]
MEDVAGKQPKPLFVDGVWRPMSEEPVHNGLYELEAAQPAPGEAAKLQLVKWKNGKWKGSIKSFVRWRGRELAEMSKHTSRRTRMEAFRLEKRNTHEPAAQAAWILARRAISLGLDSAAAYRYYLIAHGIAGKTLKRADLEWVAQFSQQNGGRAHTQKELADRFFAERNGRPSVVTT